MSWPSAAWDRSSRPKSSLHQAPHTTSPPPLGQPDPADNPAALSNCCSSAAFQPGPASIPFHLSVRERQRSAAASPSLSRRCRASHHATLFSSLHAHTLFDDMSVWGPFDSALQLPLTPCVRADATRCFLFAAHNVFDKIPASVFGPRSFRRPCPFVLSGVPATFSHSGADSSSTSTTVPGPPFAMPLKVYSRSSPLRDPSSTSATSATSSPTRPFASSRIGRSGDVRYDKFPGSSPAVFHRWLSGSDLKTVALFGCPSVERRTVFASKRSRAFFNIPEDKICGSCKLRSSCQFANQEVPRYDKVILSDTMRILAVFVMDACPEPLQVTDEVKASVCKLLKDTINLSN